MLSLRAHLTSPSPRQVRESCSLPGDRIKPWHLAIRVLLCFNFILICCWQSFFSVALQRNNIFWDIDFNILESQAEAPLWTPGAVFWAIRQTSAGVWNWIFFSLFHVLQRVKEIYFAFLFHKLFFHFVLKSTKRLWNGNLKRNWVEIQASPVVFTKAMSPNIPSPACLFCAKLRQPLLCNYLEGKLQN